nr:hypothetical protein [Burkholderiales bacterium]
MNAPDPKTVTASLPEFAARHIGPDSVDQRAMLDALGLASLEALIDRVVPDSIRDRAALDLPQPTSEPAVLAELGRLAARNRLCRSYIGT